MYPPMNSSEFPDAFKMTLNFNGFNREDLRIMLINENQVWAYGGRSKCPGFGRERLHYHFPVPKGADPKKITASFDDKTTTLVITIPKFDEKDNKVSPKDEKPPNKTDEDPKRSGNEQGSKPVGGGKDISEPEKKNEPQIQTHQGPSDNKVDASHATTPNTELAVSKQDQSKQTNQGQSEGAALQSDKEQEPKAKGISEHGKKSDHEELLMFIFETVLEFLKESKGLKNDEKSVDDARKHQYLVATAAEANKLALFALEKLKPSSRQ